MSDRPSDPHGVGRNHLGRRTWDKEYFERKASSRGDIEDGEEVEPERDHPAFQLPRKLLEPRTERVDVDSRLGKANVITSATPLKERGGFYCSVCECSIRDSANWLDHINGKKHMRNMGYSLKSQRSTVDQVRNRLKEAKRKKMEEREARMAAKQEKLDMQARAEELQLQEEAALEEKRRKRREKKRRKKAEDQKNEAMANPEADMLAMMGLPTGFGS